MIYELKKGNEIICKKAKMANSFWLRLSGLMFRKNLGKDEGMLFESKSIHTHFMRFSLDIIFLDKSWKVIKVIKNMKPWRMTKIYWRAKYVLELKSDYERVSISEGDKLEVICTS